MDSRRFGSVWGTLPLECSALIEKTKVFNKTSLAAERTERNVNSISNKFEFLARTKVLLLISVSFTIYVIKNISRSGFVSNPHECCEYFRGEKNSRTPTCKGDIDLQIKCKSSHISVSGLDQQLGLWNNGLPSRSNGSRTSWKLNNDKMTTHFTHVANCLGVLQRLITFKSPQNEILVIKSPKSSEAIDDIKCFLGKYKRPYALCTNIAQNLARLSGSVFRNFFLLRDQLQIFETTSGEIILCSSVLSSSLTVFYFGSTSSLLFPIYIVACNKLGFHLHKPRAGYHEVGLIFSAATLERQSFICHPII